MRCGEACWGTWQEGGISYVGRVCDHPQDGPAPTAMPSMGAGPLVHREKEVVCFVLVAAAGNGWAALMEWRDYVEGGCWVFPGGKPEITGVGEMAMQESHEATLAREMWEELSLRPVGYRSLGTVMSEDWRCTSFLVTSWTGEVPADMRTGAGDRLEWRLLSLDQVWPASGEIARRALEALGPVPVDERNEHLTHKEVARLPATDEPRPDFGWARS